VRGRSGLAVGEVRPSGGWPGLDAIAVGDGRPRGGCAGRWEVQAAWEHAGLTAVAAVAGNWGRAPVWLLPPPPLGIGDRGEGERVRDREGRGGQGEKCVGL
jgi:hypothetical protein